LTVPGQPQPGQEGRVFRRALLAAFALTFVFALLRFDGPAKGYWDTYITAPAMFMNAEPVDFVLKDGQPAWDFELRGDLPADLVDEGSFGIITKDQRIGAPIVAAPLFAAFGQLGFRLLFALVIALLIPTTLLACRVLPGSRGVQARWAALAAGVVLAWNPYVLSVDRLNANTMVLPLCLVLLYLLGRERTSWIGAGLVFGVIAGVRNEAICFVPAICFWLLVARDRQDPFAARFRRLFVVGLCTVVAMLPIFYWKWFAFGHPLMHPSQFPHFQGFRPEFSHSLLGWEFRFNGLFNWPLHSELVRTPHFGFPTYLLFPLVTVRALGLVGAGALLLGAASLTRRARPLAITMVLWMLPVYVLFGPQENWEEVKMTFMLLAWPPLALFLAEGICWLATGPGKQRLGALVGASLLVGLAVNLLGQVDAPQDLRWYVRFPNASLDTNPAAQEGLAEEDRNDWLYFQSYETADEIARERAKLTAALPWPAPYLPLRWDFGRELDEMGREAGVRELEVLEIWGYIYGTRR